MNRGSSVDGICIPSTDDPRKYNKVISSREDVLEEIIWNNQHLRIENKPIFGNKLLQKGIAKAFSTMENSDHGITLGAMDYILTNT